ncbi:MAG: uncharacterized protein JWQ11_4376, partial [Rhizobacter sp.]|nr:uncharacterized protein [Rhizobacter sp.]
VTLDLSVTPFCNTFLIHRVPRFAGATLEADVAFIDGETLAVTRSRQRYERQDTRRLRYLDLGLSKGFEASLSVDEQDIVVDYEHLFERVEDIASNGFEAGPSFVSA